MRRLDRITAHGWGWRTAAIGVALAAAASAWAGYARAADPPAAPSAFKPSFKYVSHADRGGYWLERGRETSLKLRLRNHSERPEEGLRVRVDVDDAWIAVALREPARRVSGTTNTWDLPVVADGATIEIPVSVTVAEKTGSGENIRETLVRDQAAFTFTAWKETPPDSSASAGTVTSLSGGLPPPERHCWIIRYVARAATKELALPPPPLEWHLVEAEVDETRPVTFSVQNLNNYEPLNNVVALASCDRPFVEVTVPQGGAASEIPGVPGLRVVKPQVTAGFNAELTVLKGAEPGDAVTVRLGVRTSTPGTTPSPWEPILLVHVRSSPYEVPGNFEAFLFYNLPPLGVGTGAVPTRAADGWMPLPKGTKISISEVYPFPGTGGEKLVEQFVGYGHVLDDKGYVCCNISPYVRQQPRLRIVAETMASTIEPKVRVEGKTRTLIGYKAGPARAAVTPFGKRTFRCISQTFRANLKEQKPRPDKTVMRYVPDSGSNPALFQGKRILIPYFGYEKVANPSAREGILIDWEGELSTGGIINYNIYDEGGLASIGGAMTLAPEAFPSLGETSPAMSKGPGLIYHNRNELLHILAGLVRSQDFLGGTRMFTAGADTNTPPPSLPGVIALWRKQDVVPGGETGYALQPDGTFRLAVQSREEDPDERDIGLVLRGYGAAVRRQFFRPPAAPPSREEQMKPRYHYYEHVSLERAWQEGFDIFFSAGVMNSPAVLNESAAESEEKIRRSVNLEDVLRHAREAAAGGRATGEALKYVGADNPVAVAAGLWCASKVVSRAELTDFLLKNRGAHIGLFLEFCAGQSPALLRDMAALGLCPRVDRWPPPSAIHTAVHPRQAQILWDARNILARGRIKGELILGAEGAARRSTRELKSAGDAPVIVDFASVPDQQAGKDALLASSSPKSPCLWTIRTWYDDKISFTWPLQIIPFSQPDLSLRNGLALPLGPNSQLSAPPMEGSLLGDSPGIGSIFDGRNVLGHRIHRLNYLPPGEEGSEAAEFPKPVELVLGWDRDEDPGPTTPGIYRLDPASGRWELAGDEPAGERKVRAQIRKTGTYALMADREPPQAEDVFAGPNPFLSALTGAEWRVEGRFSESAVVGLSILDSEGRLVRTPVANRETTAGDFRLAWDGRDDQGRAVKDGTYRYVVTARDRSGLDIKPMSGSITVFNGDFGSASGTVQYSRPPQMSAVVRPAGFSLSARCAPSGAYELSALPTGRQMLAVSCPGFFDETVLVDVPRDGASVPVPVVRLEHLALDGLEIVPEVFTPDGDGTNDYASLRFNLLRACPVEAVVLDIGGARVRGLRERKILTPGRQTLVWNGEDDDGQPLPGGWYAIRLTAFNGEDELPQGEVRVLLDRGLAQDANAFPFLFSPNADGFEDVLQVGFFMEGEGRVALRILQPNGAVVVDTVTNAALREGWCQLPWDGRGADGRVVPDGRYRFELRPEYLTGHASKIVSGDFAVDSRPPEIGDVSPANGAVVESPLPTVTARLLSDPADIDPDQLKFKIDEQTVNADRIDLQSRTFSYTPKTSIGPGPHIAIAYAQDWAGNFAAPQAVSFTVQIAPPGREFIDRTPPAILELEPAKGTTVYTPTPLLRAKIRDLESGIDPNLIAIEINGVRVPNAVKRFIPGKSGKPWDWYGYEKALVLYEPLEGEVRYVPLEPLPAGRTAVSLQVSDKAGNVSAKRETIFDIVVDREPPAVAIRSPRADEPLATTAVTLVADLKDAGPSGLAADTLRVTVDGESVACPPGVAKIDGASGSLVFPLPAPLSRNARHAVSVSVRDRAGNLSAAEPRLFSIVEDADAPRIDLLQPVSAARFPRQTPIAVSAAVFDVGRSGLDESSVSLRIDGRPVPRFNPSAASAEGFVLGAGQLTYEMRGLLPGRHELEIRCRDRAGNEARPVQFTFEVQ